jgi:hypothetical protein
MYIEFIHVRTFDRGWGDANLKPCHVINPGGKPQAESAPARLQAGPISFTRHATPRTHAQRDIGMATTINTHTPPHRSFYMAISRAISLISTKHVEGT